MTAPVWMAQPPEVHSTLLSSGPGPGPLLAAAEGWSALSAQYASAANELTTLLAAVQAGTWQGPSAGAYLAAHTPYLAWLVQKSADSTVTAVQHATAATAYTAAVAAMPTLPELAANHIVHGVLTATNFFGINTIPIALNEADYVRMWAQAATTMSTYQASAAAAVASVPSADPAPQIMNSDMSRGGDMGSGMDMGDMGPPVPPADPAGQLDWLIQQLSEQYEFLIQWMIDPSSTGFTPQMILDAFTSTVRALSTDLLPQLLAQPTSASMLLVVVYVSMAAVHGSQLVMLAAPSLFPLAAFPVVGLSALGGLGGLSGLAGLAPALTVPLDAGPAPAGVEPVRPVITPSPASTVASPSSAPVTVSATAPGAPPGASPPPPLPAVTGAEAVGYPYLVAPPGVGSGSGMGANADEPTAGKAAEPSAQAAAAVTPTTASARRRRRSSVVERVRGLEYMDLDGSVPNPTVLLQDLSAVASERGAGVMGFAGTAVMDRTLPAAGLTSLVGNAYGDGPTMPMMPGAWNPDPAQQA